MRENKIRPEISFLVQFVLPTLSSQYGYPQPDDSEHTKIQEIPVRIGSTIYHPDVVYYWDKVPLLLIEAKKEGKSEKDAQDQALSYVRNFPTKEYSKDGRRPRFVAITIGENITCYHHRYELIKNDFKDKLEKLDTIPSFEKLLLEYGLSPEYKPITLTPQTFQKDFLSQLMAIYNLNPDHKITREIILNISQQILSYLEDHENYSSRQSYTLLDTYKDRQASIRQLFSQYDVIGSLNPANAKEFRRFVLRSFQGTSLNQYMTEQCVIAFMVEMAEPQENWKVLDFECGSGGFLAAVLEKAKISLENIRGIDIDNLPYIIAKTYLAIYFGKHKKADIDLIPIKKTNGLYYYGKDWDLVISNPAGSDKYLLNDRSRVLENLESDLDLNGRPDSFSEYNFSIQQAVRSAKVDGKICLILPEGFFSNSQDEILRKYLAKHCRILAIVSLPRGVFKRGTEVKQAQRGKQIASMKMSILYAQKGKEVIDGEGLILEDANLDYPVFLANVRGPENKKDEISDWLESKLNLVLEQWKNWKETHQLSEPSKENISDLKISMQRAKRFSKQKHFFENHFSSSELPFQKKPKRVISSKTKISKGLEDIFGKSKDE